MPLRKHCALGFLAATLALPAIAQTTPEQAAKLAKSLTPLGAEMAGNTDGSIPKWEGGITKPLPSFHKGGHYPDPYAGDKVLFTIDAGNVERYKDHLTPGQIALLKKYPDWKMNVYPSHRSASYPKAYYDATIANATRARLTADGVEGTTAGLPFPIPNNGLEAIWNHNLNYKGDAWSSSWSLAAVLADGSYTPVRHETVLDYHYGNLSKAEKDKEEGKLLNFMQTVTAPARLAGQILLVHEYVDPQKNPRKAWTYNPGQRRVRLAPNVGYDNPGQNSDGLRVNDDYYMFNGSPDRYDWKLLGKKELYVPYNSYKLLGNSIRIKDVLRTGHINPDPARYELHRVWVLEATLKPGMSHIYKKRVFYLDEDSWSILLADKYDRRDQLWRVSEAHNINYYDVPMPFLGLEVDYDLQAGRYLAAGLRNEEMQIYVPGNYSEADFTPGSLRSAGTR